MVINVLCESSLIELNNPFSNMTLDEAFNMFTENVNIALNEEKIMTQIQVMMTVIMTLMNELMELLQKIR